jgi:hypothetical protein
VPTPSFIGGNRWHKHQRITRIWYQTLRISQATFYRYVALGRRAAEGLR